MHQALTVSGSSITATLHCQSAESGRMITAWATSFSVILVTRSTSALSSESLPSCCSLPTHALHATMILSSPLTWQNAEELFLEGIRRDPQSVNANYWYAELLINTGKHERSIPYLRRAMELDPTYRPPQMTLALEHMFFADANAATDQMVALWHNRFESRVSFMLTFIAFYYSQNVEALEGWLSTGNIEAADRDLLQRFIDVELRGQIDADLITDINDYYWRRPDYVFGYWMLGHLGAHGRVFEMLNFRLDNGWLVDLRPFWTPDFETREQPEFMALLNRVGLIEYWDEAGWGSICLQAGDGMDCSGERMTPERLKSLLEADSVP